MLIHDSPNTGGKKRNMTNTAPLRLVALDPDDLQVISAQAQDAVVRVSDMAFLPKAQRFALILNRFDWQSADTKSRRERKSFERHRSALNFDRVLGVKAQNLNPGNSDTVLELLAIQFAEADAPAGLITLIFAGGGAVRLEVECIEVQLEDLGAVWSTSNLPEHILEEAGNSARDKTGS